MQKDPSSARCGPTATAAINISSPFKSQLHPDGALYTSPYSPVFPTNTSISESDSGFSDATSSVVSNHLHHSRSIKEHQEIVNRHSLCLTHLREATREAEALRQENTHLQALNRELNKQLSLLFHASAQNHLASSSTDYTASLEVLDAFRGFSIEDEGSAWDDVAEGSPTSVIESGRVQNVDVERFSLPKSISVRSNGYLKVATQANASGGGRTRSATGLRSTNPLNMTQKVYVPGGKQEEEPLELEVYNQGMFKTELCNKWQETGACPYANHCQFAHGVEELRPVLRHPRYKTEVCRMVLAGVSCPYGHRCHFRHALTDQEKAIFGSGL
ncbi:zinc finger CCCH domain-containing protein 15-like [Juglans microcarpa x Juglans regia]|uniref:zinc finger CCCH domain-containing protein 15-like n=1 Tax=Juglans microcarpa x Juglans regia TaxID=2249226 RepID=UPI001B7DF59F|nr:zinc finger CCCH domain-containing protein 15-like [Juglans microcarpa x Juglans regia]